MKYLVIWTDSSREPHYFGTDERSEATAKFDWWVEQYGNDPTKGFCLLFNFTDTPDIRRSAAYEKLKAIATSDPNTEGHMKIVEHGG